MCAHEAHEVNPCDTKQPTESIVYKLFFFIVMVARVCNVRARAPSVNSDARAGLENK